MKTSLDHLPENKRAELARVMEVIHRSDVVPELVMLFGSHSRNDWVYDVRTRHDGTVVSYISDYDILILVATPEELNRDPEPLRRYVGVGR